MCLFHTHDEPTLISPYLLLGDSTINSNPDLVNAHGITHIINMARKLNPNCRLLLDRCLKYKHIKCQDTILYDIRKHFEEAFEVIDHARETQGRVLIHCKAGRSRSGNSLFNQILYFALLFYVFNQKKRPLS